MMSNQMNNKNLYNKSYMYCYIELYKILGVIMINKKYILDFTVKFVFYDIHVSDVQFRKHN